MSQKFLYFAYGSNMLAKRIHINSPNAVKLGYGTLEEFQLDFKGFTDFWQGAPATVIPDERSSVMGVVWEMDMSFLANLDAQEGVNRGHYYAADVSILFEDGEDIVARAYIMKEQPLRPLRSFVLQKLVIPFDRKPSITYLQCMVKGAIEAGIPNTYIDYLRSIKHNGRISKELENQLELKRVELHG